MTKWLAEAGVKPLRKIHFVARADSAWRNWSPGKHLWYWENQAMSAGS
jgi:hypothetical protein